MSIRALVDDVVLGAGLAGLVDGAVAIGGFAVEPGMVVPGAAVCARAGEASREPRRSTLLTGEAHCNLVQ